MGSKGTLGSWGVSSALGSFHPDLRIHPCEPLSWYPCPSGVWFPSSVKGQTQLCCSPLSPFSSGTCGRGWFNWVKSSFFKTNHHLFIHPKVHGVQRERRAIKVYTHIFSFLTLFLRDFLLGFWEANHPAALSLFCSLPSWQSVLTSSCWWLMQS